MLPDETRTGSLLTEGGKIIDIDAGDHASADEVIECEGLHLIPGVVDDQVHFRDPGLTHKEDLATATRACAVFRIPGRSSRRGSGRLSC